LVSIYQTIRRHIPDSLILRVCSCGVDKSDACAEVGCYEYGYKTCGYIKVRIIGRSYR